MHTISLSGSLIEVDNNSLLMFFNVMFENCIMTWIHKLRLLAPYIYRLYTILYLFILFQYFNQHAIIVLVDILYLLQLLLLFYLQHGIGPIVFLLIYVIIVFKNN